MVELGFGVDLGLLDKPEDRYILELLHMHTKKLGVFEQWPSLSRVGFGDFVRDLLQSTSSTIQKFGYWHRNFIDRAIAKNSHATCGILAPIIQSGVGMSNKSGHNRPQMLAEGSFITFTASDANGTTLSAVQHYLAHYPRVYAKLKKELRSKYIKGERIGWGPDLASCEYLSACINESWRLVPPACGVHWRECERTGVRIGEQYVPMGCDIGMSLFTLFRNEKFFRKPTEFWPERWLEGTLPEAEYSTAKHVFTPFSVGPRACAGSHVAVVIASISIAHIVVNYDFRLADEMQNQPGATEKGTSIPSARELKFESHFTLPSWEEGPFLQFRERP